MSIPPKALAGARRRKLMLGDKVEALAKPVAKMIDRVLGTDLENCGGCAKRKRWLNGQDEV